MYKHIKRKESGNSEEKNGEEGRLVGVGGDGKDMTSFSAHQLLKIARRVAWCSIIYSLLLPFISTLLSLVQYRRCIQVCIIIKVQQFCQFWVKWRGFIVSMRACTGTGGKFSYTGCLLGVNKCKDGGKCYSCACPRSFTPSHWSLSLVGNPLPRDTGWVWHPRCQSAPCPGDRPARKGEWMDCYVNPWRRCAPNVRAGVTTLTSGFTARLFFYKRREIMCVPARSRK